MNSTQCCSSAQASAPQSNRTGQLRHTDRQSMGWLSEYQKSSGVFRHAAWLRQPSRGVAVRWRSIHASCSALRLRTSTVLRSYDVCVSGHILAGFRFLRFDMVHMVSLWLEGVVPIRRRCRIGRRCWVAVGSKWFLMWGRVGYRVCVACCGVPVR